MNSETASEIELSIIIVNWNSRDYLYRCLSSLRASSQNIRHEILVVDNASTESLNLDPVSNGKDIQLIALDKNYGFGVANNKGAAVARGRYLLFLNPDTVVKSPETLNRTINFIKNNQDYGCVGVRSLKDNGETQSDCARTTPSAVKLFLEFTMLDLLVQKFSDSQLFRIPRDKLLTDQDVEIISGSFMLIPSDVFRTVGGFRKDIFLYGEDTDLCLRIRHNTLKIRYMGTTSIIHSGSGATRKETYRTILEYQCQGYYQILKDYYGIRSAQSFLLLLIITLPFLVATGPTLDLYRILTGRKKYYHETIKYMYALIWSAKKLIK